MKEKMVELMKQAHCECVDCIACEYKGQELCCDHKMADFFIKNGVTITRAEDLIHTASLDYEAEYHKLLDKHNLLYADFQAMESELIRLRAQMDVVCLIFGGK